MPRGEFPPTLGGSVGAEGGEGRERRLHILGDRDAIARAVGQKREVQWLRAISNRASMRVSVSRD